MEIDYPYRWDYEPTMAQALSLSHRWEWPNPTRPYRKPITASERSKRKAARKQARKSKRRNRA